MNPYATGQEIAAFAQEFTDDPDAQDILAGAASRIFDKLCGVEDGFFLPAGNAYSLKTFYGDGTAYLKLPPYTAINPSTPVVIYNDEDETVEVPDYVERDGFLVIRGYVNGIPTRDLMDAALTDSFNGWPVNDKITVSAKWGFTETPADVKQAVIQIAINNWRASDPAFTSISQSGTPNTLPEIPAQAKEIADRYRDAYNAKAVFA